ncbi:MAG: family 16 glycosylhydrolase [Draconibacterium sp.]|nr:family 16 glycosylhydrolase [Draconibacterium sp.]
MIDCPNCEVSNGSTTFYGDYAGGEIVSKKPFQYGIFECKAKYATQLGSWPAFWVIGGDDTPCPPGGYGNEIDIAEVKCQTWITEMGHVIFRYYPPVDCNISNVVGVNSDIYNMQLNDIYYDYKCIWTPNKISYYINDNLMHEVINSGQEWYPELYLQVILSQQIITASNISGQFTVVTPQTSYFEKVSVKRFFATPVITCPGLICSTETATLAVDTPATNITWSLSPGYLFSGAITGSGTSATIIPSSSNHGLGKISFSFDMPSGESYSVKKDIRINGPGYDDISFFVCNSDGSTANNMSGYWLMCPNTTYHIYVNNDGPCSTSNYNWTIPSAWTKFYTYQNMISVNTNSSPGGPVSVDATTCCNNEVTIISDYMGTGYNCGYYYMTFTPNPATNETILTLETTSEEKVLDENTEWELEVYSPSQSLKEKKTKLKGKEHKIQTQGWKEGIYFVRVKYKNEILQGKLVVKK